MAEQGTTNISLNAMATLVGETASPASLATVCGSASINKWSFYRPRPIQANGTTKLVEFASKSTNWKLGDFRRYDHVAATPAAPDNFTRNWGPGGTTFSVTFAIKIERLNVKELVGAETPYYTIKYYGSSANRAAKTSVLRTYTTALPLTSESPPVDHSNDQTQAPSTSLHIITDSSVPTSIVTSPDDILYCDVYISNAAGTTELVRFDDSFCDVTTHENQLPYVSETGPNFSIAGYTASFIVVNNSSSACAGADVTQTFGSQNASFRVHLVGLVGGTWYRLAATSISLRLDVGGTKYTLGVSSLSGTANTLVSTTDFFGTGDTWAYDDIGEVEIVSVSGVSNGTSPCTP